MGDAFCECPFETDECTGYWDCEEIAGIAEEFVNNYDANGD